MRFRPFALFVLLLFSGNLFSQTFSLPEPIESDVYPFLETLSARGVLSFDDIIRPLSRKYLAEKLIEADQKKEQLTGIEKKELTLFLLKFQMETQLLGSAVPAYVNPFQPLKLKMFLDDFYNYNDSLFNLHLSPIISSSGGFANGDIQSTSSRGLYMRGYIGYKHKIGFNFFFEERGEHNVRFDLTKRFSSSRGFVNTLESTTDNAFSMIRTTLSYGWTWGNISAGMDNNTIGYGISNKLILSDKAPAFPFIRLDIFPAKWIHFNYLHGWLSSGIVDSNKMYNTNGIFNSSFVYRTKYIASHSITLIPSPKFSFTLGESVIYSDRFEPSYLIPLMFFKATDHYLSLYNIQAGDNGQFYFQLSSKNFIPKTHLYASLFIDEIRASAIFVPAESRNQLGFMLGAAVNNVLIPNSLFTLEYTRTNPFVYSNFNLAQTYVSAGYPLGSWIGANADYLFLSYTQKLSARLHLNFWASKVRMGDQGTIYQQYYQQPQPVFLFSKNFDLDGYGLNVLWKITPAIYLNAELARKKLDGFHPVTSTLYNFANITLTYRVF